MTTEPAPATQVEEVGMKPRVNITDQIHSHLREAIVSGEMKPGSLHSVYKVAEKFNVSRTPVREAVLRLADTGMVIIVRNRGFRVRGVTVEDIREVFELRLLLEVPAAAYAATHGGPELMESVRAEIDAMHEATLANDSQNFMYHDLTLHDSIIAVMGNRRLSTILGNLRESTRSRGVITLHRSRGLDEIENEHAPIVDALTARDPAAAAMYMEAHLVQTGTLLMGQVASVSGEEIPEAWARRLQR